MSNPWETEPPEQTLLSILAAQGCHGHQTEDDIKGNVSLRVTGALHEISCLSDKIRQAELEILNRNLYRDSRELVCVDNMSRVQAAADEVAQTLTVILDNREELGARLKAPHQEGRLVVEARYQKYAVSSFEKLGSVLSQLSGFIGNIEKYQNTQLDVGNVEKSVSLIVELTNSLKSVYDNLRMEQITLSQMSDGPIMKHGSTLEF